MERFNTQRIALLLQYDGSGFQGSQSQNPSQSNIALDKYPQTVQATLNQAFISLGFPPVKSMFAGRTDKGVHAFGQVAHVDCCAVTLKRFNALLHSLNAKLPSAIRVLDTVTVLPDFNAQHRALWKWYRYQIISRPDRTQLLNRLSDPRFTHFTRHPINRDAVQQALSLLEGTHDFSSFARPKQMSTNPICTLHELGLKQPFPETHPDLWVLDFKGDRFLYGMVRLMVGLLLKIGAGQLPAESMREVLATASFEARMRIAPIAPPEGLCLMQVEYPVPYQALFMMNRELSG